MKKTSSKSITLEKSFAFAVKIIRLVRKVQIEQKEFIITKQICRSGTSIGANLEEAIGGISKADFIHKVTIAYKEARETSYWLRLMRESDLIDQIVFDEMFYLCDELNRLLYATINTAKKNKTP